ncbi:MAG: ion channel [Deltaproteobacteria bacterium]|nr:ion channel [Deltaproteobacteria bacterium]
MHKNLVAWSRSLRFLQLTVFILLFILILPFMAGHPFINLFFQLVLLNALMVSLSASDRLSRLRWVLVALWTVGMVLFSKYNLFPSPGLHQLELVLAASFYLLFLVGCIAAILTYVFKSPRVTLDTIFAAVVAYFLVSIIFSTFYSIVYSFNPASFNLTFSNIVTEPHLLMTEMVYFSLSTIVGVGFGDILPLLPFPRMVAVVEAVVGHFYMAVLIGWLVGMFISQALRPVPEPTAPESLNPPGD